MTDTNRLPTPIQTIGYWTILPWQATTQCAQRVSTCDKNSNHQITTTDI